MEKNMFETPAINVIEIIGVTIDPIIAFIFVVLLEDGNKTGENAEISQRRPCNILWYVLSFRK
jgi:hypothetical protein